MKKINAFFLLPLGMLFIHDTEKPSQDDLSKQVWKYIDTPYEKDAPKILESIANNKELTCDKLETILRKGRQYENKPTEYDRKEVELRYCDYKSTYQFQGPSKYSTDKKYPLIFTLHGGGGSTKDNMGFCEKISKQYMEPWRKYIDDKEIFVASPASDQNWGATGSALVIDIVEDICKSYPIDPDKVYVWGQSMGGNASWRFGMHFTDHFGGVAPITCGYKYKEICFDAFHNTALYHVYSNQDGAYGHLGKWNHKILKKLKLPNAVTVERKGGHTLHAKEIPDILELFIKNPRNNYPKKTIAQTLDQPGTFMIKEPFYNKNEGKIEWKIALPIARAYWIQITESCDKDKTCRLVAEIDGNTMKIEADNVKSFNLFLHDKLVDMDKEIIILNKDKELFKGKVERSVKQLLEEVRSSKDSGRIYYAKIKIDID